MAEDPQPQTIQQRIAALNKSHVGRLPGTAPPLKPKRSLPSARPALATRQKTINNPPAEVNAVVPSGSVGNEPHAIHHNGLLPPPLIARTGEKASDKPKPAPPPLPRRQSTQPSPALPPRRPSEPGARRDSEESTSSVMSSISAISSSTARKSFDSNSGRVKAPAWGESELPPLPSRGAEKPKPQYTATEPKYHMRVPLKTTQSTTAVMSVEEVETPKPKPKPSLPPRLPPRKEASEQSKETSPRMSADVESARKSTSLEAEDTIVEKLKRSALSFGPNQPKTAPLPQHSVPTTNDYQAQPEPPTPQPPPVPLSSRPDLAGIQATKPRPSPAISHDDTVCMKCRDFSRPDNHASRYPRHSLPTQDLRWLATELTSPFPSLTDKARAIFTWLHYNIRYDVDAFFNNCVKPATPATTLATGLAVCEGYAGLFTALATFAGLESIVISGDGKGYGYRPLTPGQPIPPVSSNHAWNAVKIDGGVWKLIDSCWGAGHVGGPGVPYQQKFTPEYFTMSNDEFGLKHFPTNKSHFFRDDGRPSISWEEYSLIDPSRPNGVEPPLLFSNSGPDYGISEKTLMPQAKKLTPSQSCILRFQFGLICEHWTLERHTKKGPPPVFFLLVHGVDGRGDDYVPLEYVRGTGPGGGGDLWYCDVDARELGTPGQTLTLFAVSSFGQRQDARGLTVREFREGKGRVAMGFAGVAAWDLV